MAKRPTQPTVDAPPRAPRKSGRPTPVKPPRPRAALRPNNAGNAVRPQKR